MRSSRENIRQLAERSLYINEADYRYNVVFYVAAAFDSLSNCQINIRTFFFLHMPMWSKTRAILWTINKLKQVSPIVSANLAINIVQLTSAQSESNLIQIYLSDQVSSVFPDNI